MRRSDSDLKPGDRVRGILLGRFGRFGQSGEGTHLLAVNLDYRARRSVAIVGPGPLEVYDAATGKWESGGNRVELRLPGGGGKLVRLRP